QPLERTSLLFPAEPLLEAAPPDRSHPTPERVVATQLHQRAGQFSLVLLVDEHTRCSILYRVRQTGVTGCDHWETGRHRLDHRHRQALLVAAVGIDPAELHEH